MNEKELEELTAKFYEAFGCEYMPELKTRKADSVQKLIKLAYNKGALAALLRTYRASV